MQETGFEKKWEVRGQKRENGVKKCQHEEEKVLGETEESGVN